MQLKSFSTYVTESTKEVSFVFGRFNPPTIGHEKLFDTLKKVARSGVYRIYSSKSVDPKKNPLQFKEKIKFIRKMFPKHARNVMADPDVRNALDICVKLYDQGFTKVTMVVGSDRIKEFDILLNKYNGVDARHGFYQFEGAIRVVSAGDRDPDKDDVSGMSASKMRLAAAEGSLQKFAQGLPKNYNPQDLYYAVRKGMGLKKESFRQHIELPTVSETREEYIEGNLYNVGDTVRIKETKEVGKVITRGPNYLMIKVNDERKRVWLESVETMAGEWGTKKLTDRWKKETPGQQVREKMTVAQKRKKSNYYKDDSPDGKLSKSTASKRHAQFAKQAKMDDDDPRAYKPAPGDKSAETKPSQYTKKFKKMYGEMAEYITFEDYMVTEQDTKAALMKKADKSGIAYGILKQVFDRGVAAWRTGHRPGTTPVQWGLARVNSFITKGKTWSTADADLAKKV